MNRRRCARHALCVAALLATASCVALPPAPPVAGLAAVEGAPPVLAFGFDLSVTPDDRLTFIAPAILRSEPAPPGSAAADAPSRSCLAQAVYYEARSEPLDGQRAVAQVVLNRLRDAAYPKTICKVVFQRTRPGLAGCQFTFTCDGSLRRPLDGAAWRRARVVADDALTGIRIAGIGNATRYHRRDVAPAWSRSLRRVSVVGAHIFYAERL